MDIINLDLCNVLLFKQEENDEFVWYRFEVNFETDEFKYDSKKRKINIWKPKFGFLKLEKKHFYDATNNIPNFTLIKDQTDSAFFKISDKSLKRIIYMCIRAISSSLKGASKEFPQKTGISTC